jgi:o-succinylbenzoate synthase
MLEGLAIEILEWPLRFRKPAKTSRDVLTEKPSWIVVAKHPDGRVGWGECSLIPGLSPEHPKRAAMTLKAIANQGTLNPDEVSDLQPAVKFAVETALIDLITPEERVLFPGPFTSGEVGIPINGLVWMDSKEGMLSQVDDLLARGFQTIKWKVGTLPFAEELELAQEIRRRCPVEQGHVLRVDANGAFSQPEAGWTPLEKCERLADLELHSIEQPLKAGHWKEMQALCERSPLPIALDEELIGLTTTALRRGMLAMVRPAHVVLKPSLIGGLREANHWIDMAEEIGAGWWATSALESNIGLNAIAQWSSDVMDGNGVPQGLGTGGLFENNVQAPLKVENGALWMKGGGDAWSLTEIKKD